MLWLPSADWRTPLITGCAAVNNKACRTRIESSAGRRINQDGRHSQDPCAAKFSSDVLHAWSLFRRQAAADSGEEYSAMVKIVACFVPDRISPGADLDAQPQAPQSKAA